MSVGEAAAERLQRAVEELIRATEPLGSRLYHLPGEGEWSAMQNLAHVAEFLPFWAQRARDVAAGQYADRLYGRTPEEMDERGAAVETHASDDMAAMVASLRDALSAAAATLRAIPDDAWDVRSVFEPGDPPMTVTQIVEQRVLGHVQAHLRQATEAAASAAG